MSFLECFWSLVPWLHGWEVFFLEKDIFKLTTSSICYIPFHKHYLFVWNCSTQKKFIWKQHCFSFKKLCFVQFRYLSQELVMNRVSEIGLLRPEIIFEKIGWMQVLTKAFLQFFHKFFGMLKFEKSSKIWGKQMKKSLVHTVGQKI